MARYTCLFTVAAPTGGVKRSLGETLQACHLDIIYETADYLMAREIPGHVAFSKLVTVEVLFDKTVSGDREVRMNFVIKNEELPLQVDNHCRQMFERINQAIADSHQWKLIEAVAS